MDMLCLYLYCIYVRLKLKASMDILLIAYIQACLITPRCLEKLHNRPLPYGAMKICSESSPRDAAEVLVPRSG